MDNDVHINYHDIDMNHYIKDLANNLTNRVLISVNWKEVFNHIKSNLISSKSEVLIDTFFLLEKLINKVHNSDFEIKSYFNKILPELFYYLSHTNTYAKTLSNKILKQLSLNEENIEFIIKYTLSEGIESNDYNIRLNSVLGLRCVCDNNFSFFLNKQNYSRKIISNLIYLTSDKSEILSQTSIETLKYFISNLPNYYSIAKQFDTGTLERIEQLMENEKINEKNKMREIIQTAEKKTYLGNDLNQEYEAYKDWIDKRKYKNKYNKLSDTNDDNLLFECTNGFYFGVFPQLVIEGVKDNCEATSRLKNMEKIKFIFEENINNSSFLRFISTFYEFISTFIQDNLSNISLISLQIIDRLISSIPGVNLKLNVFHCINTILSCLGNNNISIRDQAKEVLKKIMVIVPSSTILPFFINKLNDENWFLISEILNIILYMFEHLNEIYNDIDYSEENFDEAPFIRILSLFMHDTPKIRISAKKIIKFVGEKVIKKDVFLNTLENLVSNHLYEEIKKLFKYKNLQKEVSNYLDYYKDQMEVASSQKIKNLREQLNIDDNFNNEEHEKVSILRNPYDYKNNKYANNDKSSTNKIELEENNTLLKSGVSIMKSKNNLINNFQNYDYDKDNEEYNDEDLMNKIELENKKQFKDGKTQKIGKNNKNTSLSKLNKQISKTKYKKYNDKDDPNFENKYDKTYDYSVKERDTLSPLKYPESVYSNIYPGLKSNLDWEKQFKSIDHLRKIMVYNQEILYKDSYYFSIIFDQILQLLGSIRPHLCKNNLKCLSEIFEIKDLVIDQKIESIVKSLVKKIVEKNSFIAKECKETLFNLIINCNYEKAINSLLVLYGKNHSKEYYKIIIDAINKALITYQNDFISGTTFHLSMNFITNTFSKEKSLRQNFIEFFISLDKALNGNKSYLEDILKRYFSNDTMLYILKIIEENNF